MLIVFSKAFQTLLYLAFAYTDFSICLCCLFGECFLIFQISAQVYKLFSIFCLFHFCDSKGPYKTDCLKKTKPKTDCLSACFPLPESDFLTFEFLKLLCALWNLRYSLNIFWKIHFLLLLFWNNSAFQWRVKKMIRYSGIKIFLITNSVVYWKLKKK